ncbi:hypothetical protein [Paraburkholderia sp. J8-2]|uniref:hypothetical protein n=1 Tax=Paraburkholderia sp. J8-2 TaxID=2805440 RepID=UPI002AB69C17|nr:hypothetical protein [Paraburkholderia sp. J8-2]
MRTIFCWMRPTVGLWFGIETETENEMSLNNISFGYSELTRHVELQVGVFMAQAKATKNRREREAFENRAKGVLMAWATLVYKPLVAHGEAAHEAHRDDYARMLELMGDSDLASSLRNPV